jgi:DNA-binding GntR family transcriptional regulator
LPATAKEKAYNYVKSRIIDRSLKEGDFLTEVGIAKELGISRTPVREAFLLLETENFVRLVPKKGALIPRISLREIREVMEARMLIELFAAERAVERRSELGPRLKSSLEDQERLVGEGKIDDFVRSDREFHFMIVSAARNNLLAQFYEGLRDRQIRMGIKIVTYSSERVRQVLSEHAAIADSLDEGDVDKLKDAIRKHLDATLSILMEQAFK